LNGTRLLPAEAETDSVPRWRKRAERVVGYKQVEFTMMRPPKARLRWFDGEYSREFEAGKSMKVSELLLLPSAEHLEVGHDAKISAVSWQNTDFKL
jgi:hypothetical protein